MASYSTKKRKFHFGHFDPNSHFGRFGQPFPSQGGHAEKKAPLGVLLRLRSTRPSYVCKAAQPRSSEKNVARRAGQTPCARWAVGICDTRAKSGRNGREGFALRSNCVMCRHILVNHPAHSQNVPAHVLITSCAGIYFNESCVMCRHIF